MSRASLFGRKKKTSKRGNVNQIVHAVIAVASWISVAMLTISSLSVYVNPISFKYAAPLGLFFPIFLGCTLFMLMVSLLFAPRRSWIVLLGLLLNFFSIRNYCPVNLSSTPPENCLKFISYNCQGYGSKPEEKSPLHVAEYLEAQHADIICLQEANAGGGDLERYVQPTMKSTPYFDSIRNGKQGSFVACFSRFPILSKKVIASSGHNIVAVFKLLLDKGDTLTIINNHLKSIGLSAEDRSAYSSIVHRQDTLSNQEVEESGLSIIQKIATASKERAVQVDSVADFIELNKGKNIILCGDFNDTPISYAHHRFADHLSDCFVATGNGIGRTFNRYAMIVRIDHILCNTDYWKPHCCRVDNSIRLSDHYPVSVLLERKR